MYYAGKDFESAKEYKTLEGARQTKPCRSRRATSSRSRPK